MSRPNDPEFEIRFFESVLKRDATYTDVIEILGGDAAWDQETVTYASLMQGKPYDEVFNPQMIIDLELASAPGGKAFFTLQRPVMQRLLDGRSKGILIRPLGALSGSIYASENPAGHGPVLHFNTRAK